MGITPRLCVQILPGFHPFNDDRDASQVSRRSLRCGLRFDRRRLPGARHEARQLHRHSPSHKHTFSAPAEVLGCLRCIETLALHSPELQLCPGTHACHLRSDTGRGWIPSRDLSKNKLLDQGADCAFGGTDERIVDCYLCAISISRRIVNVRDSRRG